MVCQTLLIERNFKTNLEQELSFSMQHCHQHSNVRSKHQSWHYHVLCLLWQTHLTPVFEKEMRKSATFTKLAKPFLTWLEEADEESSEDEE